MILITNPQFIQGEISLINALFEQGLETLHLRKPDASFEDLVTFIGQIDCRFQSRIMIHSHFRLINKFHLKGLHFTEITKHEIDDYKKIICVKSQSVHCLSDLCKINQQINYIFLSPIFPSISKVGYFVAWNNVELIDQISRNWFYKIAALGGISLDNVKQIKEMGFDDYALLGSIWEPFKDGKSVSEIVAIYKSFKNEL